jgi:bifunctional DNase/RNase
MLAAMEDPAGLMTIGRFARLANLSVHRLRHYHEVGLLLPAHVDQESGYRYYASLQLQVADLIAVLRSLDLPLAQIRRLLASPDRDTVAEILSGHRRHLETRFQEAERRLRVFEQFLVEGSLVVSIDIPRDQVPVHVTAVRQHPATGEQVVVLAVDDDGRQLPIWIGAQEAAGIALCLSQQTPQRPGSHDFLSSLVAAAEISIRAVTIWKPEHEEDMYVAAVELEASSRTAVLDARPSDAINLALRVGAPIRVSEGTLRAAAEGLARPPIRLRLTSENGEELGETEVFREPRGGDHVRVQQRFEVTEVREAEGGSTVTVRELPNGTHRSVVPPPR